MISKVLYSNSPKATINYVMNPKKNAEVYLSKGVYSLFDKDRIIQDFVMQSALHPSMKVKALHIPLSFHVNDTEALRLHSAEILQDWLDRMESHGYHFDQYIIVRHHDQDHKNPHFHLVANIVLNDGSRANLANIGKACKEASISVTEKWGLTSAKHAQDELIREQNKITHDVSSLDVDNATRTEHHLSLDSSNTLHDTGSIGSDGGSSALPDVGLKSVDVAGIADAILFPKVAPAVSSGGGGGKKDDDNDEKKKSKLRRRGRR